MSRVFPLTLALSPNTKNVLEEREQIVGRLTQGGASGSCAMPSGAPLGLYQEEAASCRFTNVQSPECHVAQRNISRFQSYKCSSRSENRPSTVT